MNFYTKLSSIEAFSAVFNLIDTFSLVFLIGLGHIECAVNKNHTENHTVK